MRDFDLFLFVPSSDEGENWEIEPRGDIEGEKEEAWERGDAGKKGEIGEKELGEVGEIAQSGEIELPHSGLLGLGREKKDGRV